MNAQAKPPTTADAETDVDLSQTDPSRAFRNALGGFATGVTVVTTRTPEGAAIGLTVSSFNSVSLEPPLVLWSLSVDSPNRAAFEACEYYAINVLALEQVDVSQRFASRVDDKFSGLSWTQGLGGVPVLGGCRAWFEVKNVARHAGGDHIIFVGQVERFGEDPQRTPLIFQGGAYRALSDAKVG